MARNFLNQTDVSLERQSCSGLTLPVPALATDGWAVGVWIRLKTGATFLTTNNNINQLLSFRTNNNEAYNGTSAFNLWWAPIENTTALDVGTVSGKVMAYVSGWTGMGDNTNASNWTDTSYGNDNVERLFIFQLEQVLGNWKFRIYEAPKNGAIAQVNESNTVTPQLVSWSHVAIGDRVPSPGNRDWSDDAGQVFIINRPLTTTEMTSLATGTTSINQIISGPNLKAYWPLESADYTDQSGNANHLTEVGGSTTYSGFNFVSSSPPLGVSFLSQSTCTGQLTTFIRPNTFASNVSTGLSNLTTGSSLSLSSLSVSTLTSSISTQIRLTLSASNTSSLSSTLLSNTIILDDTLDSEYVDHVASTVINPTSSTPTITLTVVDQLDITGFLNICCRVRGMLGKTPTVIFDNVMTFWRGGLSKPPAPWEPVWQYLSDDDFTWRKWDTFSTALGGGGQQVVTSTKTAAFTEDTVVIAFKPRQRYRTYEAKFNSWANSAIGVKPSYAINGAGVTPHYIAQHSAPSSPPNSVAPQTVNQHCVKLTSPLGPTLGSRKLNFTFVMGHHPMEDEGGWSAMSFIDRFVNRTGPVADFLRRHVDLDVLNVNPTGLIYSRERWTEDDATDEDSNRAYSGSTSPQVNAVKAAAASRLVDVFMDIGHGDVDLDGQNVQLGIYYNPLKPRSVDFWNRYTANPIANPVTYAHDYEDQRFGFVWAEKNLPGIQASILLEHPESWPGYPSTISAWDAVSDAQWDAIYGMIQANTLSISALDASATNNSTLTTSLNNAPLSTSALAVSLFSSNLSASAIFLGTSPQSSTVFSGNLSTSIRFNTTASNVSTITSTFVAGVAAQRPLIRDALDGRVKELPVIDYITGKGSVPVGGTVGQVLTKVSGGSHDVAWSSPSSGAPATIVEVDFGMGSNYVEATVIAAWATTNRIICLPAPPSTTDHDPEDALLEDISASVLSITNGVSFVVGVSAPNGTWGRYSINCIGV